MLDLFVKNLKFDNGNYTYVFKAPNEIFVEILLNGNPFLHHYPTICLYYHKYDTYEDGN